MSEIDHIRQLPHSLTAEQSVIGAVLQNPSVFDDAADLIDEQDFHNSAHRTIWAAVRDLVAGRKGVDAILVAAELARRGEQDDQLVYLAELQGKTIVGPGRVRHYAGVVRNLSRERDLARAAMEVMDSVFESDMTTAEKVDHAQSLVMALKDPEQSGARNVNTVMRRVIDEIENRFQHQGIYGLPTGFADIDNRLNGLRRSDLIVLAGRPSMGKTSLAMNIVEHITRRDHAVLVFSLEMSSEQLMERMIASAGGVDFGRMRTGKLQEDDWPRLSAGVAALKDKPIHIDDTPGLTINQVRGRARKAKRQHNIELVVIDYLQMIHSSGRSTEQEVATISRSLKELAKELDIPVIAISQLNRNVEGKGDRRPQMSDLRYSGAIEQDADIIGFVYRDEVYNPDTQHKGVAEIIWRKFRNGETGTDFLISQLGQCRFRNCLRPVEPVQQKVSGFDYENY